MFLLKLFVLSYLHYAEFGFQAPTGTILQEPTFAG
jgi:hypothetical protein